MATKDSTTLREFINRLERLSENGKYDNIRVVTMDNDDECLDLGWYGIDYVYPIEELEENIEEEDCKIGSSEWTELRAEYKSLDSFIRAFVEYMKGE